MGRKILVIDDETDLANLLKNILAISGYDVRVANDAENGFRLVREFVPELIFLDISLPDANGLDVCKKLKEDPTTAGLTIVFLSTLSDGDTIEKAVGESHADWYITKPFEPKEILDKTRKLLSIKK